MGTEEQHPVSKGSRKLLFNFLNDSKILAAGVRPWEDLIQGYHLIKKIKKIVKD